MTMGEHPAELVKAADVAMYDAAPAVEKRDDRGAWLPVVTLVSMTPMPLRTMAAAAELYRGGVVRSAESVDRQVAVDWWEDMTRTALKAPLEFVNLHFLFENVTRAFTHQLVRQRTAVYVQESQRFAVKDDAPWAVGMPPGIATLPEGHPAREDWMRTVEALGDTYLRLVDYGIPAEDARGLLPTNILTKVHYATNLRNLAEHAGMRLCTQAQFEWRQVWAGIVREIVAYGNRQDQHGNFSHGDPWEFKTIAGMFRPVCYRTGKCEFMAQTDRYCAIRDRVNSFAGRGVPSSEWESEEWGTHRIHPAEWLLDPAAARTRNPDWRRSAPAPAAQAAEAEAAAQQPPVVPDLPELPEPPEPAGIPERAADFPPDQSIISPSPGPGISA